MSTVLDTQAEGVRKRKTGQRSLETKSFLSAWIHLMVCIVSSRHVGELPGLGKRSFVSM